MKRLTSTNKQQQGVFMRVHSPHHVTQVRMVLRGMVPAKAIEVQEMLHTRCSGCPSHYCPNDPAVMGLKWRMPEMANA